MPKRQRGRRRRAELLALLEGGREVPMAEITDALSGRLHWHCQRLSANNVCRRELNVLEETGSVQLWRNASGRVLTVRLVDRTLADQPRPRMPRCYVPLDEHAYRSPPPQGHGAETIRGAVRSITSREIATRCALAMTRAWCSTEQLADVLATSVAFASVRGHRSRLLAAVERVLDDLGAGHEHVETQGVNGSRLTRSSLRHLLRPGRRQRLF